MLHDCYVSPDTTALHVTLRAKSTQLLLIHPSVLHFCKTDGFILSTLLIPDYLCIVLDQKKYFLENLCNWNIMQVV